MNYHIEDEFMYEYTAKEEKHQALADVIMAKIINDFQADATEVMRILADNIRQMVEGERDGECLIAVINGAISAPFDKRHEPCNRWIIDAIYSKALSVAEVDL